MSQAVFIGSSPAAWEVRREVAAAARSHATLLILGEPGTGKGLVARRIHAQSARRHRRFVSVNCGGTTGPRLESELFGNGRGTAASQHDTGLLYEAHSGTLVLNQVAEMSLQLQARLLRFTETFETPPLAADVPGERVDVRLIAATHRDLHARVREGAFLEDLYYRLNIMLISLPPLRDRREDILVLFRRFLALASASHRLPRPALSAAAEQLIETYEWPGNLRELKNLTEWLVLAHPGRLLSPDDLPSDMRGSAAPIAPLHVEKVGDTVSDGPLTTRPAALPASGAVGATTDIKDSLVSPCGSA